MKSSSGAHYIALDHVRALAAFMVIAWHFTHDTVGYPAPFNYTPAIFPLALLDEGHTGVALFMTLSGYLFAKLLDGKSINYAAFIWNRALRLLPLLVLVIVLVGIKRIYLGEELLSHYAKSVVQGPLYATLPNGGWSITAEFHFYLLLPLLLWLVRKSKFLPLAIVSSAIALRFYLHQTQGEVQTLAYWTIVGRIDQFALGIFVYQFRDFFSHRHILAAATMIAFAGFYWCFDLQGGFFNRPSYPSTSYLWIVLPTIEGAAYAVAIAWYESSFSHSTSGMSKFIGKIGELSYSIYLLHFFFVFRAAEFVNERIMDISNFYVACLWSVVFLLAMLPVAYLSFRFIESPFLKLRRRYIVAAPAD